jgi:hypothetical protein
VDLRNIRTPIVVFCSMGDNVTPPQQALDWILDVYDDVDEIRAATAMSRYPPLDDFPLRGPRPAARPPPTPPTTSRDRC